MARRAAWLLLAWGMALPVWAVSPGTISGRVKNSAGIGQMGAMVEVLADAASPTATVFTNADGFFAARELHPGRYYLKISAPAFLPALRKGISLHPGANLVVDVTLSTLFEAMQALPARRRNAQDQDDWKWTLRSAANRPILRVVNPAPVAAKASHGRDALTGTVAFLGGSEASGFGSAADMTTSFQVEKSLFTTGRLSLDGDVGYGNGSQPGTVMRASYSHKLAEGSEPRIMVIARRFATPDMVARNAALQALAVSASDTVSLLDFLDLNLGSEYQTIQFMGHVASFWPFGSADFHLSPDTVVEYRYATSVPNTRHLKGFDSAPADLSESGPRVTLNHNSTRLERARHQEISLSQRIGNNALQVAWYSDHLADTALIGLGEVTADSGEFLPDFYSGTFTYEGRSLNANGVRVLVQRKIGSALTATVDYSWGGVLALDQPAAYWSGVLPAMTTVHRHAVTCKVAGYLLRSRTTWMASYKWTGGGLNLTPVDLFNLSAGQSDPYLNIFIRQPVPGTSFLPGHMEALLDVRNLLAQGYIPVVTGDGQTLYLAQSARAIRGGIAFTF